MVLQVLQGLTGSYRVLQGILSLMGFHMVEYFNLVKSMVYSVKTWYRCQKVVFRGLVVSKSQNLCVKHEGLKYPRRKIKVVTCQ